MIELSHVANVPEILQVPSSNFRMDSVELAEKIDAILRSQFGFGVRDLRVTISETGLILDGIVSSYHSKQLAQHVAKKVSGRTITANKIHVC